MWQQVGRNRDVPYSGAGLGLVVGDQAFGPHDSPPDVHHAVDGVEVLAAQLEHLSVPQGAQRAELDGEPQFLGHGFGDQRQLIQCGGVDLGGPGHSASSFDVGRVLGQRHVGVVLGRVQDRPQQAVRLRSRPGGAAGTELAVPGFDLGAFSSDSGIRPRPGMMWLANRSW